jgi:hypothetical protein
MWLGYIELSKIRCTSSCKWNAHPKGNYGRSLNFLEWLVRHYSNTMPAIYLRQSQSCMISIRLFIGTLSLRIFCWQRANDWSSLTSERPRTYHTLKSREQAMALRAANLSSTTSARLTTWLLNASTTKPHRKYQMCTPSVESSSTWKLEVLLLLEDPNTWYSKNPSKPNCFYALNFSQRLSPTSFIAWTPKICKHASALSKQWSMSTSKV